MKNYIEKPKTQHELQQEYVKAYECYPTSWELYEMDVEQRGLDIREEDAWMYNYKRSLDRRSDDKFEECMHAILQKHIARTELRGVYISAETGIELQNLLYESLTEYFVATTIREIIETVISWYPDYIINGHAHEEELINTLVAAHIETTLVTELTTKKEERA